MYQLKKRDFNTLVGKSGSADRRKDVTHLYVGGGFPRASQCSITFLSPEPKEKIMSSGSWMKTGPNSRLSVKTKAEEEAYKKSNYLRMQGSVTDRFINQNTFSTYTCFV